MATARRGTVLVVEDAVEERALLATRLAADGYTVLEANDGAEAIRAFTAQQSAGGMCLILLDMILPEVRGIAVLRHLVEHGDSVPVVAMSVSPAQRAAAMAAGAKAALTKPLNLDDLLAVVARYCPQPRD
jgi:CheY-like chemotaxis protein